MVNCPIIDNKLLPAMVAAILVIMSLFQMCLELFFIFKFFLRDSTVRATKFIKEVGLRLLEI